MEQQLINLAHGKKLLVPAAFVVSSGDDAIMHLFSAPGQNSIGIVLHSQRFYVGRLTAHSLELDSLPAAPCGAQFKFSYRPLSQDEIAYSRGNGFIVYSLRDKLYTCFGPVNILHQNLESFFGWEPERRQFLFDLSPRPLYRIFEFPKQRYNDENVPGEPGGTFITVSALGQYDRPMSRPKTDIMFLGQWGIRDGIMFFYQDTSIVAYDRSFTRVSHPLCETANSSGVKYFPRGIVHPTLPFALFFPKTEPFRGAKFLIRWTLQNKKDRVVELALREWLYGSQLTKPFYTSKFELSPDGNWIVFRDDTESGDNPTFWALPVEPENPMYLGSPVCLGKCLRDDAKLVSTAWADGPATFVAADERMIYRWDLTKVAK